MEVRESSTRSKPKLRDKPREHCFQSSAFLSSSVSLPSLPPPLSLPLSLLHRLSSPLHSRFLLGLIPAKLLRQQLPHVIDKVCLSQLVLPSFFLPRTLLSHYPFFSLFRKRNPNRPSIQPHQKDDTKALEINQALTCRRLAAPTTTTTTTTTPTPPPPLPAQRVKKAIKLETQNGSLLQRLPQL